MSGPTFNSERERLIVGAMSGTSADGVDAAVVSVAGRGATMSARLLAHRHRPYPEPLRRSIFSIRGGDAPVRLADLARCCREISACYAGAVSDALAAAAAAPRDI